MSSATGSHSNVEPLGSRVAAIESGIVGFDDYVRADGPRLRRSAYLLTGDAHLADDLVQTSLAKIASRWSSIAGAGDPTPYVRRVMFTTAAGWRRRRWRGEQSSGELPEVRHLDPLDHVDERLRLQAALAALPIRQRAVIVLRFYDDLTEAETAKALGCSVGTVKSHTARALARLRSIKVLHDPDPTPVDPRSTR